MIGIFVEVVILQEQVKTWNYPDAAIEVTADVHAVGAIVSGLQFLAYFQEYPVTAPDVAVDTDDREWPKMTGEGVYRYSTAKLCSLSRRWWTYWQLSQEFQSAGRCEEELRPV